MSQQVRTIARLVTLTALALLVFGVAPAEVAQARSFATAPAQAARAPRATAPAEARTMALASSVVVVPGTSGVGSTLAGRWTWPVTSPIRIVRPWQAPLTRYAAGHRGIDLQATVGADVIAPAAGVIRFAGLVAGRPVVSIDHGGGVVSSVEAVTPSVERGDRVTAGQLIGTVAMGSHCDGCVHLGVRIAGEYVSPMRFFGGIPHAVLLPLGE
ncbi:MAG TPA: M23 family metallopeptidase [Candidatus Lumbricidophila sp.]|nr:M23 family metallopeptidase [Candidatus Lumbricidophila sp.]